MAQLAIQNDGPLILQTNFWETDWSANGLCFVSLNAGHFRLLLPPSVEQYLPDMQAAREVVISRGQWTQHRREGMELLFDDGSANPFAIHCFPQQFDRLPLPEYAGREAVLTVWANRTGPTNMLSRPAYYRIVPAIPYLLPRLSPERN